MSAVFPILVIQGYFCESWGMNRYDKNRGPWPSLPFSRASRETLSGDIQEPGCWLAQVPFQPPHHLEAKNLL